MVNQASFVLVQPDRQTTDSVFFKNSGQNPDSGQNRYQQNPDRQTPGTIFRKIWTKTRQEQDMDGAVRRRLLQIGRFNFDIHVPNPCSLKTLVI